MKILFSYNFKYKVKTIYLFEGLLFYNDKIFILRRHQCFASLWEKGSLCSHCKIRDDPVRVSKMDEYFTMD